MKPAWILVWALLLGGCTFQQSDIKPIEGKPAKIMKSDCKVCQWVWTAFGWECEDN